MSQRAYPNIDRFRLIAALMVVAIHTFPWAFLGGAWDTVLTLTLCRLAVPFFFVTTGFFLFRDGFADPAQVRRFLVRTAGMYGLAMLLYLPINLYAHQLTFPNLIGDILIDGTMYHLWYFPALMLGAWIVSFLLRRIGLRGTLITGAVLYLLGLGGDSYYGLSTLLPFAEDAYEALFTVTDYTRNGLFFAPVWLALGAWFSAHRGHTPSATVSLGGLAVSLGALAAEGLMVHRWGWARHDSMYIALFPCIFFLFSLLLCARGKRSGMARDVSMLVYLLHPAVIVVLRGGAKVLGMEAVLIEQSLIHFAAVALLSFGGSAVLWLLWHRFVPRRAARAGRATRIEVDLDALCHNLRVLEAEMPRGCRMMAVVKAEAYGHGAVRTSQALWSAGVRHFAVATAEEGVALRRAGLGGEILILGYTDPAAARTLWRYRLTQTLVSAEHATALDAMKYPILAHLKIDTGMHRVGVDARDTDAIARVFGCRHVKIKGIFTHLSVSDSLTEEAVAFTEEQLARFSALREMLRKSGIAEDLTVHVQSSAGLLNYPQPECHLARVGIALYGLHSEAGAVTRSHPDLRPTLALRSTVAMLRTVTAGECVGYGCAYRAERERRIAVIPMGYADGLPRNYATGGGEVLLRGTRCPIIGRICMDQLMIDVTDLAEVTVGDTVTLIGRDGREEISAEEVADRCGTITNELLSRMGERPARIYLEGKE